MHDLVIDHARIVDGLGTPARDGSLAVEAGRIAAISADPRGGDLGPAATRVDAGGLALAPGIVDIHTHYDAQLTWDPFATPSTSLGVTTVVIGNCGFTIAPCRPAHRDVVLRNLTHVEGMSLEALLAWRPAIVAASEAEYRRVLADPGFRGGLKRELGQPGVPNRFSNHQWEHLTIMEARRPAHRHLEGKTIARLAGESGKEALDCFLDFGLDDLDALFDCRLFNTDEQKVSELLRHPHAAVALSDAGAHLSFLCDAGFGLHLLGHWARDRKDLTLEQAVRAVTSAVARAYRITDRGALVPGMWADLMLFDPKTVGRGAKRRVNDLPTGAGRLDTPAVGLCGVWVNGVRIVDERGGIVRDCGRPGRLLRDFAA